MTSSKPSYGMAVRDRCAQSLPAEQEIRIPHVFDIFDAPVHLRREQTKTPSLASHSSMSLFPSPQPRSSDSQSTRLSSMTLPNGRPRVSPLPKPIIFDGPSRAPPSWNYPPPFDTPRVSVPHRTLSQAQADKTLGVLEVFDGPARPHRRRAPMSARSKAKDVVSYFIPQLPRD